MKKIIILLTIIVNILCLGCQDGGKEKEELVLHEGDSITYLLKDEYLNYTHINNAVCGSKISDVIYRINNYTKQTPDVVVIMVGINNIGQNRFSIDEYVDMLFLIQEKFPYAEIICVSILPCYFSNRNDKMIEPNKQIEEVCGQLRISYLDIYDQFLDESFFYDGLHLSEKGLTKIGSIYDSLFME